MTVETSPFWDMGLKAAYDFRIYNRFGLYVRPDFASLFLLRYKVKLLILYIFVLLKNLSYVIRPSSRPYPIFHP